MVKTCEKCGVRINRKDRFCQKHARAVLVAAEKSGYLQPLSVMTVDGLVQVAKRRFLTIRGVPKSPEF